MGLNAFKGKKETSGKNQTKTMIELDTGGSGTDN